MKIILVFAVMLVLSGCRRPEASNGTYKLKRPGMMPGPPHRWIIFSMAYSLQINCILIRGILLCLQNLNSVKLIRREA
jgi:hypothetical protein